MGTRGGLALQPQQVCQRYRDLLCLRFQLTVQLRSSDMDHFTQSGALIASSLLDIAASPSTALPNDVSSRIHAARLCPTSAKRTLARIDALLAFFCVLVAIPTSTC